MSEVRATTKSVRPITVPTIRGSRGRLGGGGFVRVATEEERSTSSSSRGAKVM